VHRTCIIESNNERNDTREGRYLIIEYHSCNFQYPNTYTNFTSNPSPVTISCSSALSRNSASTSSNASSKASSPLSSLSIECSLFREILVAYLTKSMRSPNLVLRSGRKRAFRYSFLFFILHLSYHVSTLQFL